ncbi:MAG: right-handed parallel beta-helix repeat-containing protein, partial [bacterium]
LNNNFIGHNNRPGVAVIKQSKGIILEGNQIVENGLAGTANLAVLQGSRVSLVNNRVVKGDKVNIYVNGSEATLLKNGIKESGAHGLYFIASTGLLEDNTITSSDHYGIKLEKGSQVTIKGNKISGSGRWGGSGVGVEDSAADFQGNQIFNQQSRAPGFSAWGKNTRVTLTNNKLIGTGCKISENADAFLEGNHITHNLKAEEIGVEISSGARAVLLFNLIARHGRKGIMVEEAEATILNNNILENALGIEIDYPVKALIQNNIIMKNRSGGIECDGTAENLTLSHNNVWGNTNRPNRPKILGFLPEPSLKERNYIDCPPGRESISADPQFVNYQKSDYNLRKSSPCLKTGGSSRISHKLASKPNIGIRQ